MREPLSPPERCPHRHPRLGFQCEARPHSAASPCNASETVDGYLCLYAWLPATSLALVASS